MLDVVSSGGSPLEPAVRTDMESRLGHDFGDVQVHTDAAAHDSAQSVGAHAYTVGQQRRLPARRVRPVIARPDARRSRTS